MAAVAPFAPGTRVRAPYRVKTFDGDEILVVDSLTRYGRGRRASWRVRVYSETRPVSRWMDAADLVEVDAHSA